MKEKEVDSRADDLLQSGQINSYFYKELTSPLFDTMDEDIRSAYIDDAIAMSALGIDNRDEKAYYWLAYHTASEWLENVLEQPI